MAEDSDTKITAEVSAFVSPETDKAFKHLDDRIDRLESTATRLDKTLGRVYGASERVAKSIDRAARTVTTLARSTSTAATATEKQSGTNTRLASTTNTVAAATDKLTKAKDAATRASERQRKNEERLNAYLDKHRPKTFSARMTGISEKSGNFGNRAAIGAGVAAAGIGATWAKGMEFDKQLTYLGITAEATDKQIAGVRTNIMGLSDIGKTNQSITNLTEALGYIVASGTPLDQANKMLLTVGRSATASGANITDMSAAGVAATRNLKIKVEDLGFAFDIMNKAGKLGNFEIKDMAAELPAIASAAAAIGIQGTKGLSQITAALEVSRMGAGDNAEAANNLFNLYNKLTSKEAVDKFREVFGVNLEAIIKDAQAGGRDVLGSVLDVMQQKTGGDPFKIAQVFQDQQVLKATRALLQNRKEYDRIQKETQAAKGQTDKDYARVQQSQFARFEQFKNSIETLGIAVGSLFGPALSKVASVVSSVSYTVTSFSDRFPRLSSVLGTGTVAVVALVGAAGIVAKGISIVTGVMGGMSRSMLMLTARGRRFIALTEYRGGMSGRGTYLSGYGRNGAPGRTGRVGRGGSGRGRLGAAGGILGTLAGFGDIVDLADMARDMFGGGGGAGGRRGGLGRPVTRGGMLSRAWGATKGGLGRLWSGGKGLLSMPFGATMGGIGGAIKGGAGRLMGGAGNMLNGARMWGGLGLARMGNFFKGGGVRALFTTGGKTVARFFTTGFGGTAIRALPALLGESVGAATVGTVGAVAAAGTVLGLGLAKGINAGTAAFRKDGKTLSEGIADYFTQDIDLANLEAEQRTALLEKYSMGRLRGKGHEADGQRKAGLLLYKQELEKINAEIAAHGSSVELKNRKRNAEGNIKHLQNQIDGVDPVGKDAQNQGAAAARASAPKGDFNDNSQIHIVIEGGPNMTNAEMQRRVAEELAKTANDSKRRQNQLVRGAYADGTATQG